MATYTTTDIARIMQGKWLVQAHDRPVNDLALDSRKPMNNEALFFAIVGHHHNGHDHIGEAYARGARSFVVSEARSFTDMDEANVLLVKDTVRALQLLVAQHRAQYKIPVIGITGSNGKTIVKEWLHQLLEPDEHIVRSPKSYNSQVGVPLSVWQMSDKDSLGIFEAGISEPDEMEKLEKVIKPTIGIFTNIGSAHSEGFLNIRHKVKEKLKLFLSSRVLIYCKDHHEVTQAISEYRSLFLDEADQRNLFQLFTWGKQADTDLQILQIERGNLFTNIKARHKGTELSIEVPFSDDASIENAIHCWATMLYLKLDNSTIAERMPKLGKIAMRLELKDAMNQCLLINDTYNSDLGSLNIALDLLDQQQQHVKKTIILSDILQSGRPADDLYQQVAKQVAQSKAQRFIGIGKSISIMHKAFEGSATELHFYPDTNSFIKDLPKLSFHKETILLKGARSFEFERISKLLEQKVHETVLEINLNAIAENLHTYRSQLKPDTKIMVMVKAFSYGSGGAEIASVLQYHRADYLAVAYADEGVALRQSGVSLPIMVMNPEQHSFDAMVTYQLEPELYSLRSLKNFINALDDHAYEGRFPVHLEVESGMNRLGFDTEDMPELLEILKADKRLDLKSVFAHLAASEDKQHDDYTRSQISRYTAAYEQIKEVLGYAPIRHILNTAGIVRFPEAHFDMVRLGLGLYGVDTTQKQAVRPAGRLKTTISQLKDIEAGETVGYSRTGVIKKSTTIATVGIGYADGIDRRFSNGVGKMLVHGKLAPIVGRVCMDMCMLDVTDIPDVQEGDEVIVFGPELQVEELAQWIGTIPYEILTNVSERVKRIYFHE